MILTTVRKSRHNYSAKEEYNFNWISREEFERYKEDQEKKHGELIHKIEKLALKHEHRHKHDHDYEHEQEKEQTPL